MNAILLNRQLQRNETETSSFIRIITNHILIALLCKMRYDLIRKLSKMPHLLRILAVRYFYKAFQRKQ